ncbi:alkyl hydroperoxide reductase [Bradyrhizobium sp. CCGE-LA001]|nr:alkyl hydroperoxide reductase [Bradyrhizobium sp. CCGE-LA001]
MLGLGSKAPPIKVESWLRGQPLASFQRGRVYIVDFWATWCGPCVAALPPLTKLQEKHKDIGVEVLGLATYEHAGTADEARSKLDAWLTEKVPNPNYRIGFDYTGEMNKLWMEHSLSFGIPTLFVVDRDGHIAFIGSLMQLDDIFPKILNGAWRTSDEAKAAEAKRIAQGERLAKLMPPLKAGDWAKALSVVKETLAVTPDSLNYRTLQADLLLHKLRDLESGLPVMRQFVRDAIDKNAEEWMGEALRQLFNPANDNSHLPRAERLEMGKELSEHILALNPPQRGDGLKYLIYPTVAQYYYESGNKDRAIELVDAALKSLDSSEPISVEQKQHDISLLVQTLANYKGEKACYGDICAAPKDRLTEASN